MLSKHLTIHCHACGAYRPLYARHCKTEHLTSLTLLPPSFQLCIDLDRRLREVYNRPGQPPLVLSPHIMSATALEEQEGQGALRGASL
jgi:hypothetical protein